MLDDLLRRNAELHQQADEARQRAEAAGRRIDELERILEQTAADYQHALRLLNSTSPGWTPEVQVCSALEGMGIPEAWATIERFRATLGDGAIAARRAGQAKAWLRAELSDSLLATLAGHPKVRDRLPALEAEVAAERLAKERG